MTREHAPGHPIGSQPGPDGMYARWCKRDDCTWQEIVKPATPLLPKDNS